MLMYVLPLLGYITCSTTRIVGYAIFYLFNKIKHKTMYSNIYKLENKFKNLKKNKNINNTYKLF